MCKVISFVNNKGGVAKTTSTAVIAELLAYLQKNVLLVDLDESCNLTMYFHRLVEDSDVVIRGLQLPKEKNITELFMQRYRMESEVRGLIRPTNVENIDIIPCSKRFKRVPADLVQNTGNNNIVLLKALQTVKKEYDFILIDNAPANNILTVNSIFSSDYIAIPVKPERFSYKGVKETLFNILYIKDEYDLDEVDLLGVFITQANICTKAYKDLKEICLVELQDRFLETAIRLDTKISEIESKFEPILSYCPGSNALEDYANLLLEMQILDEIAQQKLSDIMNR